MESETSFGREQWPSSWLGCSRPIRSFERARSLQSAAQSYFTRVTLSELPVVTLAQPLSTPAEPTSQANQRHQRSLEQSSHQRIWSKTRTDLIKKKMFRMSGSFLKNFVALPAERVQIKTLRATLPYKEATNQQLVLNNKLLQHRQELIFLKVSSQFYLQFPKIPTANSLQQSPWNPRTLLRKLWFIT